jgi:cell division protein FtsI (penicillin-binding protein 3)
MAAKRDRRAKRVRREERALPSYAGRRRVVVSLMAIGAAALVWRAFDQQILEHDFLLGKGEGHYLARVEIPAERGLITDRRGDVLALSAPVDSVAANPRVLNPDRQQLIALADALGVDADWLGERLASARDRHFTYLKRRMPPAEASRVLDVAATLGLGGLHLEREYKRFYPAGEVFAHVVGFAGENQVGQEGLERAFEDSLRGEDGEKLVIRDGRRQLIDDVENIRMPRDGQHLALSIDQRLQFIAYRELKAAVRRYRAAAGSLVMLDVHTGEILAMVNQPSFNPNGDRSGLGGSVRNLALANMFEPGSTMKPLVIAAAMDAGVIAADSSIDTSPGQFYVGSSRVRDKQDLGEIDIATVLRRSSNVGSAKIALELDRALLWSTLDRLGFGHAPGTRFVGEADGHLRDHRDWAQIDQATLSFGYGVSVSALQLARAYAALGNDGLLMPVTLVKRAAPVEGVPVFSPQTARTIRGMLEGVVDDDGTAPDAALTGYRVAGKTGTVRKFGPQGYSEDRHLALFAGLAPASRPRVAMVVVIDEPKGKVTYGGRVAGPVFARVMGETLRLLNAAPDAVVEDGVRLAQAERAE